MKSKVWVFGTAVLLALPALATESQEEKVASEPAAEEMADEAGAIAEGEVAPAPEQEEAATPDQAEATAPEPQDEAAPEEQEAEVGSETEEQAMSGPSGTVARATFATSIEEREPVGEIESLGNDNESVVFFTELRGFEGRTLEHVWERGGEEMARVSFFVGGPRWRVYSRKSLDPSWIGEWSVRVVDESGEELLRETLSYVAAEEPPQDEMLAEESESDSTDGDEPYGESIEQGEGEHLPASMPE